MSREIGNFLVKEDEDEFSLHYLLSRGDWISFLMSFLMAFFFLIIASSLLYTVDQKSDFKELIGGVVVFALGVFLLFEGVFKIIRVKKNIIRIIKKENQLIHRNGFFTTKKYELSDIERFNFLEKEKWTLSTIKPIGRVYGIIRLELKNKKTSNLLTIHTKKILWEKDSLIKIEVGSIAENIIKELNRNK